MTPVGEIATSPKLQPLLPVDWSGVNGPTAPNPVTAAPRPTMAPLLFQMISTATGAPTWVVLAATTVGHLALFGGGETLKDLVDVYNADTGQVTLMRMPRPAIGKSR